MCKKAKQYIKDYTKNCSNELAYQSQSLYNPWLTPDNALSVMEITKEETINKACKIFVDMVIDLQPEIVDYGKLLQNLEKKFREKMDS